MPPSQPSPPHQQQQVGAGGVVPSILRPRPARDPLYHMKLVVRGKRGVGKSSLLGRLKGGSFFDTLESTPEIQTASIGWQYKAMDDKIEVEIWDVVDRVRAAGASAAADENDDDTPAGSCVAWVGWGG